jgi:nucleoside-triphosphatase THEP1
MEIQGDKEMRQGIRMSQHIIIDERLEKHTHTHTHELSKFLHKRKLLLTNLEKKSKEESVWERGANRVSKNFKLFFA